MSTILWHNEVSDKWMDAFPLGNGRVGAMVYGTPDCEVIEINEESLWCGKQIEEKYHASPEALAEIRKLIFEEKLKEAADLASRTFLSDPPVVRSYESFGEIFIDFLDKSPITDYRKELDVSTAVATVSYVKNSVKYVSESFVTPNEDGLCYKVRCDSGKFACKVTMKRKQDSYTACLNSETIIMNGRVISPDSESYGKGGEGMSFGAKLRIITDGNKTCNHDSITIDSATFVLIYGAFATNYNVNKFDVDESIDYKAKLNSCIEQMLSKSYDEIKETHITTHKKWFDTVSFELEGPDLSHISTDERLDDLGDGKFDPDLYTLYYNFGRYLLIESSGKNATLPANLQGIWCHDFNPPWGSDFHTNINLQMNYWPSESANLSKTFAPFVHFMKMVSDFGKSTAENVFGTRGWVINHTTDPFGRTGVHDSVHCGFFPMAGPWLCLNLWEHYEYTNDTAYLKEIYPILKGSCRFVQDYLIEDSNGKLVTSPSNSPENEFYYTDAEGNKQESMLTHGATIDFQIINALFTRTISACEALNIDSDFVEELRDVMVKLPPMEVSERYGTIREWIKDYEETEPGHRHISQLFGLYPDDSINETNPVIYEAAKKTIARRIDNGGGSTGWSRAWTICFYARLKDGASALNHLKYLLTECTAYNLFDIHPPFQIDGNFGGVAGITEMLLQSHLGTPADRIVELLPCLPPEWQTGSIKGLKARGNFTFDLYWSEGKLTKAIVTAENDGALSIKENAHTKNMSSEKEFELNNGIFKASLTKNETVILNFGG